MSDERHIPVVNISSGEKFVNDRGMAVIKDGIKASAGAATRLPKPRWLRARIHGGATYERVKSIVHEHRLATVCEEAKCPNMSECWTRGTATIMLMGDVCTRACRFCAGQHRQSPGLARSRGAGEHGALGGADGPEVRGAHLGQSR